ncbi:MAG: ATP synthase F0 subunit B, partial [Pseudomonadota bacterium]|nr:ATP synthase F0 subunit B [Pseudomonadota bacterium]
MEGIVWESVWVAVGFIVFVILVWKRLSAVINTMLDDRSAKIKS